LSAATNWIFNFALAYFVAPAFTNIQWRTYIIFGVFCAAMTVHVFFTYPETAGRSLEEIDILFDGIDADGKKIRPWKNAKEVKGFETRVEEKRRESRAVGDDEATLREVDQHEQASSGDGKDAISEADVEKGRI
jgi:hypothetical protein